jgi:hypothetical protein
VACCWWRRKTFSDGIEFPMKLEDIKKFEKRNPHIAVNVFTIKKIKECDEVGDLIAKDYSLRNNWRVLHRVHSKEYNRKYQIDQLFLKENDNYHYALWSFSKIHNRFKPFTNCIPKFIFKPFKTDCEFWNKPIVHTAGAIVQLR